MADRGRGDIRARLLATFRSEAEEHLQAIASGLGALARGVSAAEAAPAVERTFREVHTLKGAARSVGLADVEAICQACESVLGRMTRGDLAVGSEVLARLGEAMGAVARLIGGGGDHAVVRKVVEALGRVAAERPSEAPASPPPVPVSAGETAEAATTAGLPRIDTLRIATARLDALAGHAEELLPPKLAASARVQEATALAEELAQCRAALRGGRGAHESRRSDPAPRDPVPALDADLRRVEALAQHMLEHLAEDRQAVVAAVDALQDELKRLRMTPASTVLDLFPAMVRDLARETRKDVEWVARGADLEVDRTVLQTIKEPLIHLVRNAIDHGIEPPAARAQAGKPRRGRVSVTIASVEAHGIEILVADDGRGVDAAGLRAQAARAGLLTPEAAQALTDGAAVELAFRSGLSTSAMITDLSGRGLGLAIVRERVERLGGSVELATQPGAGTTVRVRLPASVATFRGLLVGAGDQVFLLPIDAVERVIRIPAAEVEHVEGRAAIRWDGAPLVVAPLTALLGLVASTADAENTARRLCVVLSSGEERGGLFVDDVLGEHEVQVKELRRPLVRVRNVAAAGLLGTGRPVLILRAVDLVRALRDAPRAEAPTEQPAPARQSVVLVVDDSITTRTMEKNLLEAAGHSVLVAADGIDAWTVLKTETVDLVVSDVDMPRMDGFELTARIRADRRLADLPVVLVTALESREDKERGIDVGANAYLIKSTFDQSNLLEIIHRLI